MSQFEQKGVLTPEEFVAAGDQLVRTSPTWQWSAGDVSKQKEYLPQNKQYLITRNVPCSKRVKDLGMSDVDAEEFTDDDWVGTGTQYADVSPPDEATSDIINGDGNVSSSKTTINLDDFVDSSLAQSQHDSATFTPKSDKTNGILRTRSYSLSIVYDKYYQTPRVYLQGFNAENHPLTDDETFEDIMQDYQNKTVTMEKHPHLTSKIRLASIHPCRHAKVMKKIIDTLKEGGKKASPEQYLFIFLKFIQSVVPTIDYDYTIAVTAR